jgi:hypothetical protein
MSTVQAGSIVGGVTFHFGRYRVTEALVVIILSLIVAVSAGDVKRSPPVRPSSSPIVPLSPVMPSPLAVAVRVVTETCGTNWFTSELPKVVSLRSGVAPGALIGWNDVEQFKSGAAAGSGLIIATLHGSDPSSSVVIAKMEVEVVNRKPPPAGYVWHTLCAKLPVSYQFIDVDLDREWPSVVGRELDENAVLLAELNGWRLDPVRFPYEISPSSSETFFISARAFTCDCEWVVKFEWSSLGRVGTLTVDHNGVPFRVVGSKNSVRCDFSSFFSGVSAPYCTEPPGLR